MPTTATITPTLGSAPVTLQAGNYSAIDDRRAWGYLTSESVSSVSSYQVTQRAAGANMTVDVASNSGEAVVTGDSVTAQGNYTIPRTAASSNVDIAAADATNPRNDLVILEVKDDQHDAGGLNLARIRVVTGTPNASAALTDAPGANGTPALPSSAMLLAVVRVAAGSTTVTNAAISDRRSVVSVAGWTSYTPTLTGTGGLTVTTGNATATGAYMKIGRAVFFRASWVLGSTSSFTGTTGALSGSLPVTAAVAANAGLVGMFFDAGVTSYPIVPLYGDSSTTAFVFAPMGAAGSYANQASFSPTIPFTWGTGDTLYWGGTYEAAS